MMQVVGIRFYRKKYAAATARDETDFDAVSASLRLGVERIEA